MYDVLTVEVVGEGVAPFFLVFFGVGHSLGSLRGRTFFPRQGAKVNAIAAQRRNTGQS
jgi:hypothetical protein